MTLPQQRGRVANCFFAESGWILHVISEFGKCSSEFSFLPTLIIYTRLKKRCQGRRYKLWTTRSNGFLRRVSTMSWFAFLFLTFAYFYQKTRNRRLLVRSSHNFIRFVVHTFYGTRYVSIECVQFYLSHRA